MAAPDGFQPLEPKSEFIRNLGIEICERIVDSSHRVFRIYPGVKQSNTGGFLHGGFILALADFALSYGTFDYNDRPPAMTLNINVNFLRAGRPGEALDITVTTRKQSGSVLFADAVFMVGNKTIAQATGVFRPMRPAS